MFNQNIFLIIIPNKKIDQLLQSYKTIYKKDKKPRLSKQLLEYMGEQIEFLS